MNPPIVNRIVAVALLALALPVSAEKTSDQQAKSKKGPYIPTDKGLDPQWVDGLFEKGELKIYQGDELTHIAMPCGGIGSGQVNVTGEGELIFTESTYNEFQEPNGGHGLSNGYEYVHPPKLVSKVANAFAVAIQEEGIESQVLKQNGEGFDDIRFTGEYPIAKIDYRKTEALPVEIATEVFSPFVPLDLRSSANPVTVIRHSVTNTGKKPVEVTFAGWMKNVSFPDAVKVKQNNVAVSSSGVSGVSFGMEPVDTSEETLKHFQLGGFSLCTMDEEAQALVSSDSVEDALAKFLSGTESEDQKTSHSSDEPTGGGVGSTLSLQPQETKVCTFLVTWHFPNYYENGKRYKEAVAEAPGLVGRVYNNWYENSFEVAKHVAENFDSLRNDTLLFRETYNDNTLPHWLANRITMPVSTLAAGNVAIWENGRMYAYEGVGFCMGTCGHVYNFVTAVSKLFPELERSVRLEQDFNENVAYSPSGRINFRGYGPGKPEMVHSYASDAQSGYVLKAYREHLMSPDNSFLDKVWKQVRGAIGYHIYKDGAEVGLEPNGVLEGKQTFWDPMWFGPNPYNNTLYLAALRAAEEMALIKGEEKLAQRYRGLFEKGRQYMDESMWNGEFYVHLYPVGYKGKVGERNGFTTPELSDKNAEGFIRGFNQGKPNYHTGGACDANQLFGQNWAQQLGLGDILPPERCEIAAKSIFQYCWTPDIATVYKSWKPTSKRALAVNGESAMVNAGWPHEPKRSFENTHDKNNVWTGLEYEASCDMINAGLLREALISLRSIHDRYHASKRNPWNEIEGSNHYSRAMHSWNVLLALSGFTHDGPAGKIGFEPRLTPENFKSFFSAAEGWGTIAQQIVDGAQQESIALKWGQLRLNEWTFPLALEGEPSEVKVTINGESVATTHEVSNGKILIRLESEQIIKSGQEISASIE